MRKKILFVFGTRPEAIKMAPVILRAKMAPEKWDVKVVLTGQHREMVDQVMSYFGLKEDYNLQLMKSSQTLFDITAGVLNSIKSILDLEAPNLVIVQGDTTTAFAGALSAFYLRIPVAHIEAGLRSGDKYSPYPEEVNRKIIGTIADFHFVPTNLTKRNLETENIKKNLFIVGNTVIDALLHVNELVKADNTYLKYFSFISPASRVLLVTAHRRESFGLPMENICNAIIRLLEKFNDIEVVFPVHPNPAVKNTIYKLLAKYEKVHLIQPLDYPHLIWLVNRSSLVLTDSGGIQEEAPALGKPVLVMREVTERVEGIEAGTAKLVGTDESVIFNETALLLTDAAIYDEMSIAINPYGDGTSSQRILEVLHNY